MRSPVDPPRLSSKRLASCAAAFALVAAPLACGKSGEASTATAPATSPDSPPAGGSQYSVDASSRTHVDLPGLKERIQGDTSAADGTLSLVLEDLTRSRGRVRIDLSTFTTRTFGNDQDATQTRHARTWLEVDVGGRMNESMRWAYLTITSVDHASATDLFAVAPVRDGQDDVRKVTLTVHGDLFIHGHQMPQSDVVEVGFRGPAGALPGAKPTRIDIRSEQPMHVTLKDFDVQPRDPAGKLLAWTTQLIAKVADTADVTVQIGAALSPLQ